MSKIDRVYDESVSVPAADRVPHSRGGESVGMTSPIRVDKARQESCLVLEVHIDPPRCVNDLDRRGRCINSGDPHRQAIKRGVHTIHARPVVVRYAFPVLLVNLLGPWLQRSVFRTEPGIISGPAPPYVLLSL